MPRIAPYAAALALAALSGPAAAQDTTLRVSNWLPPAHLFVSEIVAPWAEAVEEATEGRVAVEILGAPLGPPPAHYDLAANGVADVTFAAHGYTPGRFDLTEIAELPLVTPSSEALSVAYWRVHEAMLAEAGEHRGVKVLALFAHGPGHLYTTGADVTSLDAVSGLKVRVGAPLVSELARLMDMVPLQTPSTQTYEMLSGGVADAIYFPHESVTFFNLDTLVESAMTVEGGLYNTSFFIVMNQGTWDGLSEADQAAIDSVSGEALARQAGQAWDRADATAFEALQDTVNFHPASEDQIARIREMTAPIYDATRAKFEAAGVDFDAALQMLEDEAAAAVAGQ